MLVLSLEEERRGRGMLKGGHSYERQELDGKEEAIQTYGKYSFVSKTRA